MRPAFPSTIGLAVSGSSSNRSTVSSVATHFVAASALTGLPDMNRKDDGGTPADSASTRSGMVTVCD